MSFKVAVVGTGRMGKHHARTLANMDSADLVAVVDANEATAKSVALQRDCDFFTNVADVVDKVDAAVIATPTITHLEMARPFVEAGKAVLIEKPYCEDSVAGQELIALAEKTGAFIQIGHTERFNPVSVALRKYDIHPKFIEAHRISPYTFRSADVGVVLDMMIHDIDLVLMYAGSNVIDVHAIGVSVIGKTEDVANTRLQFANGCVADITASRLAIKTERKMRIFSENHYLSVDYGKNCGVVVEKTQNLDIIQMAKDMDVNDIAELAEQVDYRELINVEDLQPDDSKDPLTRQAEAFRATVVEGNPADFACTAKGGLEAVKVAQAVVASLQEHRWDGQDGGRTGPDIIQK